MTIALIILCPARYWPGFSRRVAGTLLRFGLPLAGANLIGLSLYNIDYIVVGHRLGAVPLGLYLLAFTISSWPSSLFNGMVTSVALPAFSRVRDDAEKLPEYLTNVVSALEGIALPVSVLTLVVARSAIITVYGSRWSAASVALVTLALFGIVRVPVELFSNIIVALGRPRALFLTQALWIVVLLPAMVIGVDTWGIKGAGIAHFVVAGLVVLPVYLFVVRSVAGLSLRKLLVAIGPPVAGSIGAGLSAALAMRATNGALQSLVVGLGAGLVVYLIIVGPWLWRVLQRAHTLWSAVGTGPSPLAGAAAAS